MARIKENEFIDILSRLPDIEALECEKMFLEKRFDVFISALGFEERCLVIPEKLATVKGFNSQYSVVFEYSTNTEDNAANKQRLLRAIKKFTESDRYKTFTCDDDDFTRQFREFFNTVCPSNGEFKVLLDISVFSSKLILSVIRTLIDYDIDLKIVYSEAAIYHPTNDEFDAEPEKWTTEEGLGISIGVGKVIPSPEYPGSTRENPPFVIAFTTFKPERTKAIITHIDETILRKPGKIIWIIGDPHMNKVDKEKRKAILRIINKIDERTISREVCTFDYKETIKVLDQIYKDRNLDFQIYISALGSKMQSLGVCIFCYVRPDVTAYLALPKKYNPEKYSEGCKATWTIDFGSTKKFREVLDSVGQLSIL
ncbi:MAG: hypothetical protein WBL85_05805 [Sedimentisphaerales bacterium]